MDQRNQAPPQDNLQWRQTSHAGRRKATPSPGARTMLYRQFHQDSSDRRGYKPLKHMPLELRPNCECCNTDLAPESPAAYICTFECTFCRSCAETVLAFNCPNCGGDLKPRPIRPAELLIKYPASKNRIVRAQPCVPRV